MSTHMAHHPWAAHLWEEPLHTLLAERRPEDALDKRQTLMQAVLEAARRQTRMPWPALEEERLRRDGVDPEAKLQPLHGQAEEERLPDGEAEAARRRDLGTVTAEKLQVGAELVRVVARHQILTAMLVLPVDAPPHQTILTADHRG